MLISLYNIFIFPGILFLITMSFIAEFYDRKLYAVFQNRVGPPWYQPVADFIKLISKEDIIPEEADPAVFKLMPIFSITAVVTAFFYIPVWSTKALFSFSGDIIVVLYLLTIPTLTLFLGGWYSRSVYATIGAMRSLIQLFAYEIPLLASILASALLADTWSLSEMAVFYSRHPWLWLANIIGFVISALTLMGKLEKGPFDIPEAETEIVAGTLTEYSGKLLGFFRLAMNMEMIVGSSLLAAVFLPFGLKSGPAAGFALYILKIFLVVSMISLFRTVFARLRIDQMIRLCWKYIAPFAFLQIIISLIIKGMIK